ncbi:vitamin B12 dependent-methionine synthase activation domain-containing protein, partial [Escherichia coli]|nr:vitamin B12 dependent-methionine synthase activation domain-containing protein [Escherichia coli]
YEFRFILGGWELFKRDSPAPKNTKKPTIGELLEGKKHPVMKLPESSARWRGAWVSGWSFSHPDSKYYGGAKIQRDQVKDYARRKGM